VTLLSASHIVLFNEYRHVANTPEVCNDVPVAKPAAPVTFVNDTVVPGVSSLVCGVATGCGGGVTVGVMIADTV